jgi:radical SAM/Cys-rich protein
VFDKSISALKKLNAVGYGRSRALHLVYNPLGASLPVPQSELEADYKEALEREFGIVFNRLFTITNQPIARFAEDLRKQGAFEDYMNLLVKHFNRSTVEGLMCRNTVSVSHTGRLYDCDFNQMLGLACGSKVEFLWDLDPRLLLNEQIATGDHCFACTAGSGSSCSGTVI